MASQVVAVEKMQDLPRLQDPPTYLISIAHTSLKRGEGADFLTKEEEQEEKGVKPNKVYYVI
ncbi:hypothetical protein Pmar_PMAR025962 [Perkinsus marinus ATCC 50983]|uniref:Uncharacterized protein n=1 Tax=Perkinsus marinus (strain ATCC 50983 / TXsc) TaxID=423536 RepID=C5L1I0_PERM5|nr:hypothetical protein Pmar_PMAR025962 [Perkinsus marinus ATCC 50983]EER09407.1 hypothetical protein Pmar_PMAR025962 [Perkinsus marinus ATCC 50983]|eukprot:XP_002777591.1 hypothetical protein Pmar_PMAR025962 [Perkinsus marinus ATCC 50983]